MIKKNKFNILEIKDVVIEIKNFNNLNRKLDIKRELMVWSIVLKNYFRM